MIATLTTVTTKHAATVLAVIAVLVIVIQEVRLETAQRRDITVGLAQDRVDATHDPTREVVVSDGANVWERRAVQATQRADALDRQLQEERVARASIEVATQAMDTTIKVPSLGEAEVIRQAPFTLSLQAPPVGAPDGGATLGVHLTADTLKLGIRVGCGPPGALGVQPASVSVRAPAWATVRLDQVEQDPAVCNAKLVAGSSPAGVIKGLLHRIGISAGYSAAVSGGTVVVRPSLTIGLKIWP